jgi:hypothetical protein
LVGEDHIDHGGPAAAGALAVLDRFAVFIADPIR